MKRVHYSTIGLKDVVDDFKSLRLFVYMLRYHKLGNDKFSTSGLEIIVDDFTNLVIFFCPILLRQ